VKCRACHEEVEPTPVTFTWWGGLLGPKLLSHVQCPKCSARWNGKTGADNSTAIAIYMVVVGLATFALLYYVFTQL